MASEIYYLRSALVFLAKQPGQLVETDVEADPNAEISGIYRYVGAGGTVKRPTKEGPAMMFNNVKGFPGSRVVIGMLSSRKLVSAPTNTPEDAGTPNQCARSSVRRRQICHHPADAQKQYQ